MKIFFHIFLLTIVTIANGQNPLVKQWDKRFGGIDDEIILKTIQTSDGGFLLGGGSISGASGDKTQPSWGNSDGWIIKIDSMGSKQWDRRYGGTMYDWLEPGQQTRDGGYILGGVSNSGISGDKSQPTWGNTGDIWIVKTNSAGVKQWDKRFGSIGNEDYCCLQQTNDGGYIICLLKTTVIFVTY